MRTSTLLLLGILVAAALLALPHLARSRQERGLSPAIERLDRASGPAAGGGHEVVEPGLGFRATFPGPSRRERLPTGGSLLGCTTDVGYFAVAAQDMPRTDVDLNQVIAGSVQGFLDHMPNATDVEIFPCVEVPGARGVDVRLTTRKGEHTIRVRARVLLGEGRFFVINAWTEDSVVAEGFLDSFALLPAAGRGV
jgi:hypothetical protein